MKTRDKIKATGMILGIALSIFAVCFVVLAWTGPGLEPPGGNVPEPLHVGLAGQVKDGPLGVDGVLRAYSNLIVDGNLGLGTDDPKAKFHIEGAIIIGTQETCDDNTEGAIRYNSATKEFEGCNSFTWGEMSAVRPSYYLVVESGVGGSAIDYFDASPYEEGTEIDIRATPSTYYRFDGWSAPAGTFANANDAETIFAMPGENVTLEASFYGGPLTWEGSEKGIIDCEDIGGTVFDTGATGTICRYSGSTVPAGWNQAADWQRYSGSWGGDLCGRNKSSGPSSFLNQKATIISMGSKRSSHPSACANMWQGSYWYWAGWSSYSPTGQTIFAPVTTYSSPTTNRVEIGIY